MPAAIPDFSFEEAALTSGMLGAPTRVARWVRETFADALAERQRQLRLAVKSSTGNQILVLPGLAPGAQSTPSAPPAPFASSEAPTVTLPPESTAMDIARFLGALALAFGAGTLVALWARGLL